MKLFLLTIFFNFLNFFLKLIDFILHNLKFDFFYLRVVDKLKDQYISINIKNKKISFYTPSYITAWRVKTLFTKEPETIDWINNFKKINNKITFWDIGANIGIYSLYAATIHPEAKIFSHEPNFKNLSILAKNISINDFQDNIHINQMPLTEKNIVSDLFYEGSDIEGGAYSSFSKSTNSHINSYKIIGANVDFLIKNKLIEFPNYIKIDIDGLEVLVLKGAQNTLNYKYLKSILIEIDITENKEFKWIDAQLNSYGFNLYSKHHCNKNSYNHIYYKKNM